MSRCSADGDAHQRRRGDAAGERFTGDRIGPTGIRSNASASRQMQHRGDAPLTIQVRRAVRVSNDTSGRQAKRTGA